MKSLAISVLLGLWIYLFVLWAYIVADNLKYDFAHQYYPLSKYVPIPEDLLAVVAFATSFVCFVAWDYLRRAK